MAAVAIPQEVARHIEVAPAELLVGVV
jgi:hypothetical protein